MTDPCMAIEPSTARPYSTARWVATAGWARRRWTPTVIPGATSRYMPASSARSHPVTARFHHRTAATTTPANGTTRTTRWAASFEAVSGGGATGGLDVRVDRRLGGDPLVERRAAGVEVGVVLHELQPAVAPAADAAVAERDRRVAAGS